MKRFDLSVEARETGKHIDRRVTTMIDEDLARIRTHRNNIARLWRLLRTDLTGPERTSLERRLREERAALDTLAATTFPIVLCKNAATGRSRAAAR